MVNNKMRINKNKLYIMTAPIAEDSDERQYVQITWKEKLYLLAFQSVDDTKLFIDIQISAMHTLYKAESMELNFQELYEEIIACDYAGVAFVTGYTVRPCSLDELEDLLQCC